MNHASIIITDNGINGAYKYDYSWAGGRASADKGPCSQARPSGFNSCEMSSGLPREHPTHTHRYIKK